MEWEKNMKNILCVTLRSFISPCRKQKIAAVFITVAHSRGWKT
jgi:hypothetical protein